MPDFLLRLLDFLVREPQKNAYGLSQEPKRTLMVSAYRNHFVMCEIWNIDCLAGKLEGVTLPAKTNNIPSFTYHEILIG